MISKAYEKADFQIVAFDLEDVLTASNVVHTTAPSTTLPTTELPSTTVPNTTEQGGIHIGSGADATFNYSDIFP